MESYFVTIKKRDFRKNPYRRERMSFRYNLQGHGLRYLGEKNSIIYFWTRNEKLIKKLKRRKKDYGSLEIQLMKANFTNFPKTLKEGNEAIRILLKRT